MDQELHDAVVEYTECGEEIHRFWDRRASTATKPGAHWTVEDKALRRQLQDREQKASKRMGEATARLFAKHA